MDFFLNNHGSIATLAPLSDEADAWIAEHIPEDTIRWGEAIVIEPRYLLPILDGIADAGLVIEVP